MKIAVLKFSGKALSDFIDKDIWINVIRKIKYIYDAVVIVHGAGNKISEWSSALGYETKFINGQRVTDENVMEVVASVQGGFLNARLVSKLNANNIEAMGLSGIDRNSFVAKKISRNLGAAGYPRQTGSVEWIYELMRQNVVPVFSSICRDNKGNLMNVNADLFTEVLAGSITADSVFFLSDVDGVNLNGVLQGRLNKNQIHEGISNGQITDGMIPKLLSCVELLNKGIDKIWIGSKKMENFNYDESNGSSSGTWIVQSAG